MPITDCERKDALEKLVDELRPIAKEFMDALNKETIVTTKHNYGKVLAFVSDLEHKRKGFGQLFLVAMKREGYPPDTIDILREMI